MVEFFDMVVTSGLFSTGTMALPKQCHCLPFGANSVYLQSVLVEAVSSPLDMKPISFHSSNIKIYFYPLWYIHGPVTTY
jgi:hypothetical protein